MGSQQLSIEHWIRLPSSVLIMKTIVCLAAFVAVSSAFGLAPPPPPPHYGRPGYPRPSPFGGAMDPTTLLLLNKNGGLGGSGSSSLLPLLLLGGGGGLGGAHGKGFNPLLFSLLGGCKEEHSPCTKIADANADTDKQCGNDVNGNSCGTVGNLVKCNKCCTCN